jgi:hypothetical protein
MKQKCRKKWFSTVLITEFQEKKRKKENAIFLHEIPLGSKRL